ncbi:unnamed protein product [Linum tenue]|uniref:Glycosyltransferase family 92 protein n=1 Tax=Linum tenue TaxID=586396 RepID=A0AAV0M1A7_9ROSI|nr:unnamed protein product [Linum tenue]
MAGPIRPTFQSSSSSSNAFVFRLLFLLALLPLTLAVFAFVLQWRGGFLSDPINRWSPETHQFPGMMETTAEEADAFGGSSAKAVVRSSDSGCSLLGPSHSASFPYYRDWKFDYGSDLNPKGVKVIYRTRELEVQQANSRVWNETWLASFFYKPCNHELFVKQSLNMEMAIVMARDEGMDWILHLDTDELIHPAGAPEYSLRRLLSDVPEDVNMVVFPNYESSVERDDIKEPFSQVSMFKKNYDHLPKEVYFGSYREATRGNPNYFLTYGNGKSAARVQDDLRPNGAHRWHNYRRTPNEVKFEEAAVLHYTYTKFSDLTSRRDRCGCKPTKEDVKRCFMLEFDRAAFIIASTATDEEMLRWYREHVVWTDKNLILKLQKKGILTRIYSPMLIIQALREAGVFSSVISEAAATRNIPIDDFSSSVNATTTNPSSPDIPTGLVHSRKIGQEKKAAESHAAGGRRLFDKSSHPPAVPPLSPPGIDDIIEIVST